MCAEDQWLDLSTWKIILVAFGAGRASWISLHCWLMGLVKAGIREFQCMWPCGTNTCTMLHSLYHKSFPKKPFVEGYKNI